MSFLSRLFGESEEDDGAGGSGKEVGPVSSSNRCPYCDHTFAKPPKRKKKCPECESHIYVRDGYLRTQLEVGLIDYGKRFENLLDLDRSVVWSTRAQLKEKFGHEPSANDVAWSVLNSIVSGEGGLNIMSGAYEEMARIARMEGKTPTPYLEEAAKAKLKHIKSEGIVTAVKPRNVNDSSVCEECRKLEGELIPIDVAISELPIPTNCTNPDGCRCWYVPHVSMESYGDRMREILDED